MAIRLQCSACNKTLQVADTAAGKKARCPSCQTLNDVPAATTPPSPSPVASTPKPTKATPASSNTAGAKSSGGAANASGKPETMLVACSSCGKASRVMKSSAGKTVLCPHCKGKIIVPGGKPAAKPPAPVAKPVAPPPKPASTGSTDIFGSVPSSSSSSSSGDIFGSVPSTPSYDVYGGGQQSNNTLWNDLGDQSGGGGGGWESMVAAPANPYSSPGYGGGYSGGGGYSAPRSTERSTAVYVISGVLIALWGFAIVAVGSVRLVMLAIALSNIPPNVTVRWDYVVGYATGGIIGLCLGALMLFGGISLATRNNLGMARTGAIICSIPCFGTLCFPVGIWATVLLFSGSYRRDFGESD